MSAKKRHTKLKPWQAVAALLLTLGLVIFQGVWDQPQIPSAPAMDLAQIPAFCGQPYVVIGDNTPGFTDEQQQLRDLEEYAPLDALGRCGTAIACIGQDTMPTEERGSISSVKPSGWHSVQYEGISGGSLYNRCHLIGWQLAGENANERNLITGTRYLNLEGMLPFENMIADYVNETGNHVLYRVTPIYQGSDLVARGVQMEAMSLEDGGESILFHVFCYNVQPGIEIDYATGESRRIEEE